ncbi:MAG: DUF362 domain-containing protein [Candidatus Riflebacteria bacterium]|nr:DUF362 domain-containing protein [Candidatus Riflebacteria bacterium]
MSKTNNAEKVSNKVYTVGLKAKRPSDSHQKKIEKLAEAIGMKKFDWKNKLVAIKTHFGERGNSAFPRPTLIRPIVDLIKAKGGKPFLAETSTLYTGSRSNAPDHIETALLHGFGLEVTGAPVFICDGLTGRSGQLVKIDGKHFPEVSVASGIFEADALVVVSHFKGHEVSGFGGTIKNLGMGCCSRTAKLAMHTSIRPSVLEDKCVKCGACISWCSVNAIFQEKGSPAKIDQKKCQGCGECLTACRANAIRINWSGDAGGVTEKMVEHALGVVKNKVGSSFYFNLLVDIVPVCDCYGFTDAPIVPNIGYAASLDPVALDSASVDWVNQQPGLKNSSLKDGFDPGQEKFPHVHEKIDTKIQLEYGEKIGLGKKTYERVELD